MENKFTQKMQLVTSLHKCSYSNFSSLQSLLSCVQIFKLGESKYLYSYSLSVLQQAGCREELQVDVTWITEVADICV